MTEYAQTYKKLARESVVSRLEAASVEGIDHIMELFDEKLVDPVTDVSSKTNPLHYREEFLERLNKFEYIKDSEDVINFIAPSMDNFDFSGRLKIIENIMEGTAGTYIEVNGKQYEALFPNKKPPIVEALDRSTPKSRMIYLVKYNYGLGKKWKAIFPREKMVRFPFSNVPPIPIFEETNTFVDDNLGKWVEEAVDNTTKKFENLIK